MDDEELRLVNNIDYCERLIADLRARHADGMLIGSLQDIINLYQAELDERRGAGSTQ
jgi:hypothetical protein